MIGTAPVASEPSASLPPAPGIGRTSVLLIGSNFATSAIGLLYWILAARRLDAAQLGVDAALVNTIVFVTNLGSLDLGNATPRFLPSSGRHAARFVGWVYAIATTLGLVVAVVYLLGADRWTPSLRIVVDEPLWAVMFCVGVVAWSIFALQDTVLIGLGQSRWIPPENVTFAVAKLGLLLALLEWSPRHAVLLSWVLPAAVFAVAVNLGIIRPALRDPDVVRPDRLPPVRRVARTVIVGNTANLMGIVALGVVPLVITERLGAQANASYYLAWTMAYVLFLAPRYVSLAVLARSHDTDDRFDAHSVRAALVSGGVVAASAAIASVLARPVLELVGSDYSDAAVDVLRILCWAAVPNVVVTIAIGWARGRDRLGTAITLNAAQYGAVLTVVIVAAERLGVRGIAWTWFAVTSMLAGVVVLVGRRRIGAAYRGITVARRLATGRSER